MPTRAFFLASLLSVSLGGCAGTSAPQNADVFSAMPRANPGMPVLSMFWRNPMGYAARDVSPQEFASPAIDQGASWSETRLYQGSQNGWFYGLSATTGEIRWKVKIGAVSSRPLVYRRRVYVGTDDGNVVCLSTEGEEQWRYATGSPILQTPSVAGDALLVSNEDDQVFSLDLMTGKYHWLYKTESEAEFTLRGHAGIAVDTDLAFTGFANGSVVALRADSGAVAWVSSLRDSEEQFVDVDTTPVVVGDLVVAASSSGGLYALDKATGRVRWHKKISGGGGLVSDGERLYFAAAEMGIYALDLQGNILWRQGTRDGGEPGQPVLYEDYLLFTLADDGLFVAEAKTGKIVQYFDPGSGISSSPTLGRQHVYVMSNHAVLYALTVQH